MVWLRRKQVRLRHCRRPPAEPRRSLLALHRERRPPSSSCSPVWTPRLRWQRRSLPRRSSRVYHRERRRSLPRRSPAETHLGRRRGYHPDQIRNRFCGRGGVAGVSGAPAARSVTAMANRRWIRSAAVAAERNRPCIAPLPRALARAARRNRDGSTSIRDASSGSSPRSRGGSFRRRGCASLRNATVRATLAAR